MIIIFNWIHCYRSVFPAFAGTTGEGVPLRTGPRIGVRGDGHKSRRPQLDREPTSNDESTKPWPSACPSCHTPAICITFLPGAFMHKRITLLLLSIACSSLFAGRTFLHQLRHHDLQTGYCAMPPTHMACRQRRCLMAHCA